MKRRPFLMLMGSPFLGMVPRPPVAGVDLTVPFDFCDAALALRVPPGSGSRMREAARSRIGPKLLIDIHGQASITGEYIP